MLLLTYYVLLSQSTAPALSAPASVVPNVDPTASLANVSTNSTAGATDVFQFASLLNSSSSLAAHEVVLYRVPGSHTLLRLGVQDVPISQIALKNTLRATQRSLRAFIAANDAQDTPLARIDDPYESSVRYQGCFFGVATWPLGYHHLTYGIVMDVLLGLWLYMYTGGRFATCVFEVKDDSLGTVGVGKLTPDRPPDQEMGVLGPGLTLGLGNEGNVTSS